MNIILKPEQEQLIKAKVNSGKYTTVEQVITEALQLLDERDKHYQKWVEDTRKKVAVGLAQLDRGEGIEVQTVINHLKEKIKIAQEKKE
jgi:antitoxin ParD1/3/4